MSKCTRNKKLCLKEKAVSDSSFPMHRKSPKLQPVLTLYLQRKDNMNDRKNMYEIFRKHHHFVTSEPVNTSRIVYPTDSL